MTYTGIHCKHVSEGQDPTNQPRVSGASHTPMIVQYWDRAIVIDSDGVMSLPDGMTATQAVMVTALVCLSGTGHVSVDEFIADYPVEYRALWQCAWDAFMGVGA